MQLTNADKAKATFDAPSIAKKLEFEVVVSDPQKSSSKASVFVDVLDPEDGSRDGRSGVAPPIRPDPPDPCGPWSDSGHTRGTGNKREKRQTRTCGSTTEIRWVPAPCGPWSAWKETTTYRGGGDSWEVQMRRTRTCGSDTEEQLKWEETETPIEVWPDEWISLDQHQGSGQERQVRQYRTSNLGNKEYRWWPDPENTPTPPVTPRPPVTPPVTPSKKPVTPPQTEVWPTTWTDTGEHRGSGQEREKRQKQVSNLGNTRYQWVPDPEDTPTPPVTKPKPKAPWGPWSSWSDTGSYRFGGRNRQKQQKRTRSRTDNSETDSETRWVDSPVEPPPPTWGPWSGWTDTGNTRGTDEYREKEQSRTRTRSDGQVQNQKRWVTDE